MGRMCWVFAVLMEIRVSLMMVFDMLSGSEAEQPFRGVFTHVFQPVAQEVDGSLVPGPWSFLV